MISRFELLNLFLYPPNHGGFFMNENQYLESYKIQIVRRMMSGESLGKIAKELGIAKSSLWGWKCKYTPLIAHEFEVEQKNKPFKQNDFVDITLASKEAKAKPAPRYINPTTVTLELGDYRIVFDVTNLNKVLEMLGYDRTK